LDPVTGRSYEHRRAWIEDRLQFLSQIYSVEIYAYAVMSNHYHLVLYYDPLAPGNWSDKEVAQRWLEVHPPKRKGRVDEVAKAKKLKSLLGDPGLIATYRQRLGSLSWFMRSLNHPLACIANGEDEVTGHFWESRFKSATLLDEKAVLSCMVYVDLNPVRARIAAKLEECLYTSIRRRLREAEAKGKLRPICSGLTDACVNPRLSMTSDQYITVVTRTGSGGWGDEETVWPARVQAMQRPQRAYGSADTLRAWVARIGQRWTLAIAMPP
jgi:REP element-mobilizing transposase RayT